MTGGIEPRRAPTGARSWLFRLLVLVGAAVGGWAVSAVVLELFQVPGKFTVLWWPVAALAVATVVRLPRHTWWWFLLGMTAGMMFAHRDFGPPAIALGYTLVNIAEVLIASLLLVGRGGSGVRRLRTIAEGLHFTWALGLALMVGAALIGLRTVLWVAEVGWLSAVTSYLVTHIIGLLVMVPLLLPKAEIRRPGSRTDLELAVILTVVVLVGWWSFLQPITPSRAFALLLPIVWAAARLGPVRTTIVTTVAVSIAAYATARDRGPFASIAELADRTWQTQLFLVSLAGAALLLVLITRHREYLAARAAAGEITLRRAIRDALVPMYSIRLDEKHFGQIQDANIALASMLGYSRHQLEGQHCGILGTRNLPDRIAALDEHLARLRDQEIVSLKEESQFVRADGTLLWVETRINRIDPVFGPPFALVYVHDLTRRQANEQMLEELALSDPLTGLANRTMLFTRLAEEFAARDGAQRQVGLLYIDLNGFKAVNDTFGHAAGDAVLIEVARRLSAAVRPGDTVARLGGDEFAVLCASIRGPGDLDHIADRIRAGLGAPIDLGDGQSTTISASIGLAVDDGSGDADRLMRAADTEMYAEKRVARTHYRIPHYSPDL